MTALKKSLVSEILISLEGLNIILTFTIFSIYSKFERTTYNSIYSNNEISYNK